jgi:quinol monooxygenase YgiN
MMDDAVYVFAHVQAKAGREGDLRAALLRLVKLTETEPGFIRYDLHEDTETPGHFAFYEIWRDQASLDLHGATPQMAAHGELTKNWVASVTVKTFRKIS